MSDINAAIEARDDVVRQGLKLCESTVKNGGWADYFSKEDGTFIEDDIKRAGTAIMLENAKRWMNTLDESTLAASVGGYRDFVYPIVRAVFPNNPIHEIVSVQPQTRKNGTIYWQNFVIGNTRGQFKRGDTLFDANSGWQGRVGYTDERVTGESLTTTAASATVSANLTELPARAGTVEVTVVDGSDTYTLRDNGNGTLAIATATGAKTVSASSVNYATGAVSVTFSAALAAGGAVTADYEASGEGQYPRAVMDYEIASAGVTATSRRIAMRISMESIQDAQAEMGIDARNMIVSAAAQQILADVGGEVVRDLWNMAVANGVVATFDATNVPTGINRAEHFRDLNYSVQQASGVITDATQRGEATFMIVDQGAANVLISVGAAGGFVKAGSDAKGQGLVYLGDYNGIRVYKYKFMKNFPGASSVGNILLGYKGADWFDTGYIHAPYQQFYTNGPDDRADLTSRQSFAMRYGKKIIAAPMYRLVKLA